MSRFIQAAMQCGERTQRERVAMQAYVLDDSPSKLPTSLHDYSTSSSNDCSTLHVRSPLVTRNIPSTLEVVSPTNIRNPSTTVGRRLPSLGVMDAEAKPSALPIGDVNPPPQVMPEEVVIHTSPPKVKPRVQLPQLTPVRKVSIPSANSSPKRLSSKSPSPLEGPNDEIPTSLWRDPDSATGSARSSTMGPKEFATAKKQRRSSPQNLINFDVPESCPDSPENLSIPVVDADDELIFRSAVSSRPLSRVHSMGDEDSQKVQTFFGAVDIFLESNPSANEAKCAQAYARRKWRKSGFTESPSSYSPASSVISYEDSTVIAAYMTTKQKGSLTSLRGSTTKRLSGGSRRNSGDAGTFERKHSMNSQLGSTTSTNIYNEGFRIPGLIPTLALHSFQLSNLDEPMFVPVDLDCAVMFVDISGYSKVSRLLEAAGAFALFDSVNSYLEKLIVIIAEDFRGQIVKFAGDAMLCLWYGDSLDIGDCVRQAAHCALELQARCGEEDIEQLVGMSFGIHIGITCGPIHSTVMRSSTVRHMEPYYHHLEGKPIREIGVLVDAAQRGEICVSKDVAQMLCQGSVTRPSATVPEALHLLQVCPGDCVNVMHRTRFSKIDCIEDTVNVNLNMHKFVNPNLIKELSRDGFQASHISKMRQLAVLFICKVDTQADTDDWFSEVQDTVDEFRATVLQIVDDDKGIHVIAAANLHNPDREPAVTGIRIAKALKDRCVGCAVGVASGVTFCGIVGSMIACRFDITGAPCVRACRLMQHATQENMAVVIDQSVVHDANNAALVIPIGEIEVKGSAEPLIVYDVAEVDTHILSSVNSATRYCQDVHVDLCNELRKEITEGGNQRHAALIRGGPCTGKVILCVRAVYRSGVVPITHVAIENTPPLDLLRTIGEWFSYHKEPSIREKAEHVLASYEKGHKLMCMRSALDLVEETLRKGCKTAVIIRQCQKLDSMSQSFLRQSMNSSLEVVEGGGRWLLFATFVPQHGMATSSTISKALGPLTKDIFVSQISEEETFKLVEYVLGWKPDKELFSVIREVSRSLVELVVVVCNHIKSSYGVDFQRSIEGVASVPQHALNAIRRATFKVMAPSVVSRISQIVDSLPLETHETLGIIAVMESPFVNPPWDLQVAVCSWMTGRKPRHVEQNLDDLREGVILQQHSLDGASRVSIANPVLAQHVTSVMLPDMMRRVRRRAVQVWHDFVIDTSPATGLTLAWYYVILKDAAHAARVAKPILTHLQETSKIDEIGKQSCCTDCVKTPVRELAAMLELDIGADPSSCALKFSQIIPMPSVIQELQTFFAPISVGIMTVAMRRTAIFLRQYAISVGRGVPFPDSEAAQVRGMHRHYIAMAEAADRHTGFQSPLPGEEEAAMLASFIPHAADIDVICGCAGRFLQYTAQVLEGRARAHEEHILKHRCSPVYSIGSSRPPFWKGNDRAGLEGTLAAALAEWEACQASAVRNGLLVLATEGWVPLNPDLSVEFQRDCYFRLRTHPYVTLLSFCMSNLVYPEPPPVES